MRTFNFNVAKRSDSVVVLGGGPTVADRLSDVEKYAQENNSVVYSSNYDHDIHIDYIVFATPSKFKECMRGSPKCRQLLLRDEMANKHSEFPGYEYYKYCDKKSSEGAYGNKKILITKAGHFPMFNIGNAGFSTIALSCLSRPKSILLVGFDGLQPKHDSKYTFRGELVKYPKSKGDIKTKYFGNVLLRFVLDRRIQLECYSQDGLWGWRDKLPIKVWD